MTLPCLSELRSHLQMILHLRWKSPVVLLRSESMHDVRLALAAGSDVDHRHDGRTALYDAFVNRRFDKMKLLLTAGCQPDVELGKCGETESCVDCCGLWRRRRDSIPVWRDDTADDKDEQCNMCGKDHIWGCRSDNMSTCTQCEERMNRVRTPRERGGASLTLVLRDDGIELVEQGRSRLVGIMQAVPGTIVQDTGHCSATVEEVQFATGPFCRSVGRDRSFPSAVV